MSEARDTILFVGAGGAVASKLLPGLAERYDIVGIAGKRVDLARYCIELAGGELGAEHTRLFEQACSCHRFHSIVWNAVRYFPTPLVESSREMLHREFDLAIALPLACLRAALAHGFTGTFVIVTSGLAFGTRPPWGSYSILKRGQIVMAEYLAAELAGRVQPKAIALGAIAEIPATTLAEVFERAIENADPGKVLYKAYGQKWE